MQRDARGAAAAAPAAATAENRGGRGENNAEGARIAALPSVDVERHPLGIIIRSQSSMKDVAFSIDKTYFYRDPGFAGLPDRLRGEGIQWAEKGQRLKIRWPFDDEVSIPHRRPG